MSEDRARALLASALTEMGNVQVPDQLLDQVARHNRHLFELTANLLDSGMDDEQARQVLDRAMESYKDELVRTIMTLRGGDQGDG